MKNKKIMALVISIVLGLAFSGCSQDRTSAADPDCQAGSSISTQDVEDAGNKPADTSSDGTAGKKVAKDGADMQTDDKAMPTRKLPENGTRINMHFGDTVIPGVLNDSDTAKALIEKLPVTVHMSRYSHDFCGSAGDLDLPYNEDEVHYGWLNGDIDYAIDAPWFTILFEDEDSSEKYGYQVNIGVIDCPLEKISSLEGSYDVLVELAE